MLGLGWRALALQGQSMLQEAIKKSWSCVGREYSCDIDNWGGNESFLLFLFFLHAARTGL